MRGIAVRSYIEFLTNYCKYEYDAPVLFDKRWNMPDGSVDNPSGVNWIKFCGNKGFAYLSIEEESKIYKNVILYSQGKVYELGENADITDFEDEITLTTKGKLLSQKTFGDRELSDALFNNYGQLSTYTWNIVIDFNGKVIRKEETIHLDQLNIDVPVSHIGTAELESDLISQASGIKQKAFNMRMTELANRACNIEALNDAFRNKQKAEREVVGVEQIIIGEIVKMDVSLTGSRSFEMRTDNRNLTVILYTDDPAFFDLSLPATVLFRGTVSQSSIYDWLVFDNCKFEAQLANRNPSQTKDGLDAKLGF